MRLALTDCRVDGGTQARVGLDATVVDDYASAMTLGEVFPHIVVFYDGEDHWVADGFHRLIAAEKIGAAFIDVEEKRGTKRDALLYAVGANASHGLRRTNADKRHAVARLLADDEWRTWSDREIARRCGVADTFVGDIRRSLRPDRSEDDVRRYITKHGTVAAMAVARIGNTNPAGVIGTPNDDYGTKKCPTCGSLWTAPFQHCPYCTLTPEQRVAGVQSEGRNRLALHHSSETPEHYTPEDFLAVVVECLGEIDLDPCSNVGVPNVPAGQHFTVADDGLQQPWSGRVYMNPPYGRDIEKWINKLCEEHERGNVEEAIALLPARTDTQWYARLRNYVCCFVAGRLTFIGNDDPAPFPSVVFYLGDDIGKFYQYFHGIGDLWQRLKRGVDFGE